MIKVALAKYFSQLILILTMVGLGWFAYGLYQKNKNYERNHEELIGTKEKYAQISLSLARLSTEYTSQKELATKARAEFKQINKEKNNRIKLLSDATYLIGRHVAKSNGPDYYFETKGKTRNYVFNEIRLAGENSPPLGFVMIKHDGRTYKGNYKFEIVVHNLQTVDEETGRVKVFSKAYLISKEAGLAKKRRLDFKNWKDIKYPLPIVDGVAYVDPTTPKGRLKFRLWAPHVNGGFNWGVDTRGMFLKPEINFSFSGYGISRNDLKWKFFHLGIGVDTELKNPDLHIMPFTYRLFPKVLTNTYFGPGVGWNTKGINVLLNTSLSF